MKELNSLSKLSRMVVEVLEALLTVKATENIYKKGKRNKYVRSVFKAAALSYQTLFPARMFTFDCSQALYKTAALTASFKESNFVEISKFPSSVTKIF